MTEGNGKVGELPKGWTLTTLLEIAQIKGGLAKGKKRKDSDDVRPVPYLRVANVQRGFLDLQAVSLIEATEDEIETLQLLPGDILFNEGGDRDKLGRGWVWGGEIPGCIHQNHVFRARLYTSDIQPKLISWYGNTYGQKYFLDEGKQTTNLASINLTKLSNLPFPLPPVAEQLRIVEKVEELSSELDQGVESLKTAQKQLKVYRQAVLKWAFEGKLTEEWRKQHSSTLKTGEALLAQIKAERENRYQQQLAEWEEKVREWEAIGKVGKKPPKPQKINDFPTITEEELSDLPDLPSSWRWINFGQLISDGPQNGLYKPASQYGVGTLIVRIDNFYDGKLNDWKTFKRLNINDDELKIYGLNSGDIIINRVNSMTHIGKCALVENKLEHCVFESNIMRLKALENFVHKKFITYYLSSSVGLKELRKNAKQAVNQASINQTDVCFSRVPICSTIEQEQIVQEIESRLSICDQLEATIVENLQKAEALRQSILKQAFEGKLVPQDPNDEPAEKLLERIKAEREATQPKTSKQLKIKGL